MALSRHHRNNRAHLPRRLRLLQARLQAQQRLALHPHPLPNPHLRQRLPIHLEQRPCHGALANHLHLGLRRPVIAAAGNIGRPKPLRRLHQFENRTDFLVQLVLTLGIVLSIVGGTSITPSANGSHTPPTSSNAGVVLYIVGFVAILFILLVSVPHRAVVPARERHVPIVIFLALPFIAVRLLYSILSVFVHDHLFSIATGSAAVNIGMSVDEEFLGTLLWDCG
ncbi:uncharacterized protein CC84DRAFT_1159085 [Paraphaeosphaeria sporulosa]|uniref:DUF7702 domain-containing protein n=1 Tax=Paraphaeosphaeria sporulosa TaxID=1460663 RepID=A0A177CVK3_9PLEO|nr:uncharacterized protein CC84DRAFT_1159085 [Paraphaeosphaeria sporulosa]OAG11594.1 hypothetical protein CC84DRAFT_1159085 [Paraphaeosphaeria sporulosa]